MTDQTLMQGIKTRWGALLLAVCASSSCPPALLAALIANESGGDPESKRFEPAVLGSLWNVLMARKPAYGAIGRQDLLTYLSAGHVLSPPLTGDVGIYAMQSLDALATSWGLTQIMGYHAFDLSLAIAMLQTAEGNLRGALKLLTQFATRFSLEYDADAADIFRCWNTGVPDGKTYDPQYVPNGLQRVKLYEELP